MADKAVHWHYFEDSKDFQTNSSKVKPFSDNESKLI